ncbi:MAG: GTPase Era [Gammaproteobacteria bacterium WSBS_2016_MAG_OTU1]
MKNSHPVQKDSSVPAKEEATRNGFVAIVGRPNVGKSTLLNALIGDKASIVSHRRQTTRGIIRAAYRHQQSQIILLDSPGWQTRHADDFNRRLNAGAEWAANAADVVVFMLTSLWSDEDEKFLACLPSNLPVIAAVNKVDLVKNKRDLLPFANALQQRRDFAAIVPLCARRGSGIKQLSDEIIAVLPVSPPLFADNHNDDDNDNVSFTVDDFFWAEIIREKIFRALGDELPYSIGVIAKQENKQETDKKDILRISAEIYAERESQKAIIIGDGGSQLKKIATSARRDMEHAAGQKIFLTIRVFARPHWRRNANLLSQMRIGAPDS